MSLGESAWYRCVRAYFAVRRMKEKSPMLMSVVERDSGVVVYPELAGARVLLTGLTTALGVDVARAFADHKARLVVQSPEDTPEMTEVSALLSESAGEIKVFN